MKTQIVIVFLVLLLAACTPPQPIPVDTQNTALAIAGTGIALTQTALPTFTPTATIVYPTPSALPTQPPFPVLTPDVIQVERWREYQTALTQGILPTYSFENILCEWDILARSGQEVYVWAVCASPNVDDTRPAVIHLGADGSVQSVEIPRRNSSDIDKMFPEAAQVKFGLYIGDSMFTGRLKEMRGHLEYRQSHPEEPPLIVLLATPTP